jgi:hypothetical protein
MKPWKLFGLILTLAAAVCAPRARAQYPPPPPPRPTFFLGMAHVDGPTDHDDIRVGRYAGRFHSIFLAVRYAPIQFDHVVIHYGNGTAETLPVAVRIPAGARSQRIVLPGGRRVISSLELWYARANPADPRRPEVRLFGMP